MMKHLYGRLWSVFRTPLACTAFLSFASLFSPTTTLGFSLPTIYTQTDIDIVKGTQVQGWPTGYETKGRSFTDVAVSGNGAKVAFWVEAYPGGIYHLYTANSDGSGLLDITSSLPSGWLYSQLEMNHDGSQLFFGSGEKTYSCNIASPTPTCSRAVFDGIWSGDNMRAFAIDSAGSTLFFRHAVDDTHKGLYQASLGGVPSLLVNMSTLAPCVSECNNLYMIRFLGASQNSNRLFFTWERDYWGASASKALYYTDGGGSVIRVPDEEHHYVWDVQNLHNDIMSSEGSRVLYSYKDTGGSDYFGWVNVAGGIKTRIAEVNPGMNATMAADGTFALFGTGGPYRITRVDFATQEERDTGSYFIPSSTGDAWFQSGLTADGKSFFNGANGASYSYLRKITMKPTVFNPAPTITNITSSAPALIHAEGKTVTITATVSDAQGRNTLDWVNLSTLVEGREQPTWSMGRVPLAFPSGDPGSTRMYDDGTHGDVTANDGVFTFNEVATRKGDYSGFNTWYSHFSLPHDVGLRIIAKDKDENYTIADTLLKIAYISAAPQSLNLGTGQVSHITIFGIGSTFTVQSSNPTVATATINGAQVTVSSHTDGYADITLTDGNGRTFIVSVTVGQGAVSPGRIGPLLPLLFLDN